MNSGHRADTVDWSKMTDGVEKAGSSVGVMLFE
jgi:hypothetical protein